MEQKQRLDYLVEKFKEDSGEYSDLAVPIPSRRNEGSSGL